MYNLLGHTLQNASLNIRAGKSNSSSNDPRTTDLKPQWQDTEIMDWIISGLKSISDFQIFFQ